MLVGNLQQNSLKGAAEHSESSSNIASAQTCNSNELNLVTLLCLFKISLFVYDDRIETLCNFHSQSAVVSEVGQSEPLAVPPVKKPKVQFVFVDFLNCSRYISLALSVYFRKV